MCVLLIYVFMDSVLHLGLAIWGSENHYALLHLVRLQQQPSIWVNLLAGFENCLSHWKNKKMSIILQFDHIDSYNQIMTIYEVCGIMNLQFASIWNYPSSCNTSWNNYYVDSFLQSFSSGMLSPFLYSSVFFCAINSRIKLPDLLW